MKASFLFQAAVTTALILVHWYRGATMAQSLAYGLVAAMAAMIAATFLWLWQRRATPLALGMAFSWAGTASVFAWLWGYTMLGRPAWMHESALILVLLAFYFTGAVHHFAVLRRTMGVSSLAFVLPLVVVGTFATYLLSRI